MQGIESRDDDSTGHASSSWEGQGALQIVESNLLNSVRPVLVPGEIDVYNTLDFRAPVPPLALCFAPVLPSALWRVASVHPATIDATKPIHLTHRWSQVLTQVYPDPRNVDDELVESIRVPSLDPNAPEVHKYMCIP